MARHVRLLAILFSIWGALFGLAGLALLILAGGAATLAWGPAPSAGGRVGLAASLTAATFAVLGVLSVLWAGVHLWCGARVRRHEPWGRMLALGLAVLNLVLLPFGTSLGAYAIWVLLTHEGRRLFEPPESAAPVL